MIDTIVQSQKIWKMYVLHPTSPPENSSLASYFASQILPCKTPLPLGIFSDLPWSGYGFFLELHIHHLHLFHI